MRTSLARLPRRLAIAAFVAALAPTLLIASPVAAANNVTVLAFVGDCQFLGANAGANKTVKIEWRDAENNLKSKHSAKSNSSGSFLSKCEPDETIETGDVFRTQIGSSVRSFNVPKLTVIVDRDADTVSGKVDTTALDQFAVEVDTYDGGFSAAAATVHLSDPAFTPNTGVASYATSTWDTAPDIKGWDDVYALWSDARGDLFIHNLKAEGMRVWARQPFIQFVGNPGQFISTDLLTAPAGALRAVADGSINPFGALRAGFTDADGDTVRTAVGNEVDANFATDSDLVIPNMAVTVNKTTHRVTVDCNIIESGSTGVLVNVHSRDYVKSGVRFGFQGNASGGTFLANFGTSPTLNIVPGDKVDVYCKFATGDIVARTFTVS